MITLDTGSWSGVDLPADVIKGCFPVSGAFDFSDRDRESAIIGSADDIGPASPINHVSGNTVPFFIAIGENDMPDLVRQAPAMADALRPQPGALEIAEFEGRGHFKISVDTGDIDGPHGPRPCAGGWRARQGPKADPLRAVPRVPAASAP